MTASSASADYKTQRSQPTGSHDDAVEQQLLRHGYVARGGQIIDATLVPASKQHFGKGDKEQLDQDAMPAGWSPAKRRQKDLDTTWTKVHGKKPLWLQALHQRRPRAQADPQAGHRYRIGS